MKNKKKCKKKNALMRKNEFVDFFFREICKPVKKYEISPVVHHPSHKIYSLSLSLLCC